jgi:WD40 repeat protein
MARATIQLNNINTCEKAAHIGHEDFIISHAFSPDETLLATSTGGTLDGEFLPLIFLWDAETGTQTGFFPLDDSPAQGLAFSPSGNLLASTGAGISLFDISSGLKIVDLFPPDQRFTSVTFSPDGTSLVVTDEKSIRIFAVKP